MSGSYQNLLRSLRTEAVPADYVGEFRQPSDQGRCWRVVRTNKLGQAQPPQQCAKRRRAYQPSTKTYGSYCCLSHRGSESKAAEYAASKEGEP